MQKKVSTSSTDWMSYDIALSVNDGLVTFAAIYCLGMHANV